MSENFQAERAYLLNVAEAIRQHLLPYVTGDSHARAMDCVHIVLRVAATLAQKDTIVEAGLQPPMAVDLQGWHQVNSVFAGLLTGVMEFRAPPRRVHSVAEIAAYLQQHPLGGDGVRVVETRALSGGRSKLTSLIRQEGAAGVPGDLVIRQDWNTLAGSSVQSEFRLLQVLWKYGVKVAKPVLLEPEARSLGAPFMMVERITGSPEGSLLTPPNDEELILNAADELGRIHALGDSPFLDTPEVAEKNCDEPQLLDSLRTFRTVIDTNHRPQSHLLDDALNHLERTIGRLSRMRALVHGDFGFHNLLFHDRRISAVLDWELSYLGHPAYDLGYVKPVVTRRIDWDRFMQRYHANGGPVLDSFTVDWFALFASLWLYHVLLKARAGVMAGALHDIEITSVCAHIGPQLLTQIATTLEELRRK